MSKNVDGNLLIITPVYNDWKSFSTLLSRISRQYNNTKSNISVLAINDGSVDKCKIECDCEFFTSVNVVNLSVNIGHQRAIAIGLSLVDCSLYNFVIVMDCDGEDKVSDIPRLIDSFKSSGSIVVAHRSERSEGIFFKLFYSLYKLIFKFLTGHKISFGNFSLLPVKAVERISRMSESWNNFPAALIKSKLPISYLKTRRGVRYFGESKMNFSSLILHGFSAISVFYEFVIIRSIMTFSAILLLTVISLSIVLSLRFLFDLYIFPGWATAISGILIVIIIQILIFLFIMAFMFLSGRSNILPLPKNIYEQYVLSIDKI
ncbi:glycosyltransferase [Candidatus Thioglobus autotrophicus]|uniref:glycosyltransferase n=1 Tax=Candidatus Thioglobus autotrophicus TaxID=1705394 RepID=UPI00299D5E8F|nr:glycosyltransferase [Candidatus Thioglobus autotrophicus]WPE17715.1 glycosyltransferase [Candidatus Thioglobus autotrophicus]